jgi:hypothetical protein
MKEAAKWYNYGVMTATEIWKVRTGMQTSQGTKATQLRRPLECSEATSEGLHANRSAPDCVNFT